TAKMLNLNLQELDLNISNLHFNIEKDYFDGNLRLKGIDPAIVESNVKSQLDLEKLDQALQLPGFDFKGLLNIDFKAKGKYATEIKHSGVRKVDTLIASIPAFSLKSTFSNGYFKYT